MTFPCLAQLVLWAQPRWRDEPCIWHDGRLPPSELCSWLLFNCYYATRWTLAEPCYSRARNIYDNVRCDTKWKHTAIWHPWTLTSPKKHQLPGDEEGVDWQHHGRSSKFLEIFRDVFSRVRSFSMAHAFNQCLFSIYWSYAVNASSLTNKVHAAN